MAINRILFHQDRSALRRASLKSVRRIRSGLGLDQSSIGTRSFLDTADFIIACSSDQTVRHVFSQTASAHNSFLIQICFICCNHGSKKATLDDAKRAELAERYASRSVELLAMTAEKGHFQSLDDIADLRTDERLQPLRGRADFQKLLSDLEKAHPYGK